MEVEEIFSSDEDSDFELDEYALKELYKADNVNVKAKPNSIKDELRTKIQQRRISEGQEELKVVFEPPKSHELTQEEKQKIQRRKHRNRLSANQSRINRQRKLENLIKDDKTLSAENQSLRAEVDALKKVKLRLQTVLQNHRATCNKTDTSNTSSGYFTNLLQDTNPADDPMEGSNMVSRNTKVTVLNSRYCSENGGTSYAEGPYRCDPGSSTNITKSYTRTGNESLSTQSERSEDLDLAHREQIPNLMDLNRMSLNGMSKEQRIAMLKAYLKGNQSKPEVQKLIGQIREMTRTNRCMQTVL